MANTGNQKLKLLCLLQTLQEETDSERGLTMPQLIERLQAEGYSAERKALYRDLTALRDAGYEVVTLPTRPVEYALVSGELGFDDVMMLVDVVQSSPFLTDRRSAQLVRNLKRIVSKRERERLEKLVHVQGRIRNQSESVFHNVDAIHEALRQRRKVEFLYYSYDTNLKRVARHDGKRYVVTPVKVVYADNNYYLAAYEDGLVDLDRAADAAKGVEAVSQPAGRMKTFRIDRMRLVQVSEQSAARRADIANFDIDEFSYQRFGMFHGEPVCVTLRVRAPLMDAIVDRFGQSVEIVKATANYADVRVRVQKSPQFFGWVAGLNGEVSIRTPKRLAAEYRDWLMSLVPIA